MVFNIKSGAKMRILKSQVISFSSASRDPGCLKLFSKIFFSVRRKLLGQRVFPFKKIYRQGSLEI